MLLAAEAAGAEGRWWMEQPVRLLQTNLRETDAGLDAGRLVSDVAAFPANALLFGMGGIVAYYPTRVPLHFPSPHLPAGRDLFGAVLKEAHARGIRVVGRFDFTKAQKAVYEAHPEWFFRKANGEPAAYNGLYATCINGGYWREHAFTILTEALGAYEVDGLFFNGIGNGSTDYSGNYLGLCHCANCQRLFRERYGRDVPERGDGEYRRFLAEASREVAARIAELIHARRPQAAFLNGYDAQTAESNTAVDRPLPLWPYSASDNVARIRDGNPGMMAFNLCIGFVDIPYRSVTVPAAEVQLRLYQAMAHGAGPAFVALGTLDQEDRSGLNAARPVFQWHAKHEDLYVGQENAARVLVVGGGGNNYRGVFRILAERHIPFAVANNAGRAGAFDVVIAPDGAPAALEGWVREGGRLLVMGVTPPPFLPLKPVRRWEKTRSAYFRIHDYALLPSLKDTKLMFLDGEYLEVEPVGRRVLTLVPPSMFGPPEKVATDRVETDKPGLLLAGYGKGRVAYLPWQVGALYYRHGSASHAGLVADLVDSLLPRGRQLKTDAHPLVEITVMRQAARRRTAVHFVNLSGHADTTYFAPVEMRDIHVVVAVEGSRARSVALGRELPLTREGGYARFTLPRLGAYDAVVLE